MSSSNETKSVLGWTGLDSSEKERIIKAAILHVCSAVSGDQTGVGVTEAFINERYFLKIKELRDVHDKISHIRDTVIPTIRARVNSIERMLLVISRNKGSLRYIEDDNSSFEWYGDFDDRADTVTIDYADKLIGPVLRSEICRLNKKFKAYNAELLDLYALRNLNTRDLVKNYLAFQGIDGSHNVQRSTTTNRAINSFFDRSFSNLFK